MGVSPAVLNGVAGALPETLRREGSFQCVPSYHSTRKRQHPT